MIVSVENNNGISVPLSHSLRITVFHQSQTKSEIAMATIINSPMVKHFLHSFGI